MPLGLSPSTRHERLAELREYALNLLDSDNFYTWQIMTACGQFIDSKWALSEERKREYLEWLKQQLKDIFIQHERRKTVKQGI